VSSKRYAQAIFQIASEEKEFDQWSQDMESMAKIIGQPEFMAFLIAKRIPVSEKNKIINDALLDVGQLARNLLYILIARDAIKQLSEIVIEYQQLLDAHNGIARGEVRTAIKITPKLTQDISSILEDIIGKQVSINSSLDNGIIGGFVAKVGDKLIDASTRTRLGNLRRNIVNSTSLTVENNDLFN